LAGFGTDIPTMTEFGLLALALILLFVGLGHVRKNAAARS
jgi:hypothetical protein